MNDRRGSGGSAPPIPMVDVGLQNGPLVEEMRAAMAAVLDSGQYILGPNVQAFEREAAEYLGAAAAIAVASGTDALHLALVAAGIGPGDEVITTPFTFIATANAIRFTGATPVFVDVDPATYNITAEAIERAITPATRAVLPVHLYGQPAGMEAITALCEERGLVLIEDCAQSFGARRGGRQTGTFGLAGCYSFYPSKNLGGVGDGGLIVTSSEETAAHLRRLRNHGSERPGFHDELGFNSRLDELQAAVLRIKLRHIDRYNAERREAAREYDRMLAGTTLTTPYADPGGEHIYHQYTVLCEDRDAARERLARAGIASAIHYMLPLHRQRAFLAHAHLSLPVAERAAAQCLCLPMFPGLSPEQIARIADVLT